MFGLYDDPGKGTVTANTTDEKKNDPTSHTVDLQKFQRSYDESRHNIKKEIYEVLRENQMVPYTKEEKILLQDISHDYVSQAIVERAITKIDEFLKENEENIHEVRDRQKVHTWFIIGLIITTIILFFRRNK